MPNRSRVALLGTLLLVGAVAGLLVLPWASRSSGWVGPGRVELQASVSGTGRTVVALPPLGRLTARTPGAPVTLQASVQELDLAKTQALASSDDPRATLDEVGRSDLVGLLRRMALRATIVGAVVGALAALLLPGRRWWFAAVGAGGAVVAVAALGLVTWARFDVDAFEQPRFEGALERAPAIIDAARRHVDDIRGVGDRVRTLGDQLADLYAASSIVDVGPRDTEGTRILHVSDLHSNPLGLQFVRRIAESFDVQAVLDTGDLTSFGYPVEARIAELVAQVPVPYLFVPGNHDSDANRAAIARFPNVRLLDSFVVEVAGVRVLGVADPTFTATNETTTEEALEVKRKLAGDVARLARLNAPDLLAVHHLAQAEESAGLVPVVVAGHSHKRRSSEIDGTRFLTVGSTGAGGIGTFMVEADESYEAQVLHFRDGRLVAVDYLTLKGISGDLTIERDAVDEGGADPAEDAVTPSP